MHPSRSYDRICMGRNIKIDCHQLHAFGFMVCKTITGGRQTTPVYIRLNFVEDLENAMPFLPILPCLLDSACGRFLCGTVGRTF